MMLKKIGVVTLFHGHSQASFLQNLNDEKIRMKHTTDSAQPYHQVLLKVSQQRY